MTKVYLLNGQQLETLIPLDEVYVLYKQVLQARARIIIQAFWKNKERSLDIRKIDPETTFVDGACCSIQSTIKKIA